MRITIVGLGAGDEDQLSLGIYKRLKQSNHIYLRTKMHPVVSFLDNESIRYETFDYLYDESSEYDQVYQKIANELLNKAKNGEELVYAVPGHPMVAEKSVQYILQQKDDQVEVKVLGGESFLDATFTALKIDPVEGFLFLNGEEITRNDIQPTKHMIISQVYDQWVASDVKLALMEIYPDEWPVFIASYLGIKDKEIVKEIPLYQLDHHSEDFHHLSSVFIPKTDDLTVMHSQFAKLVEIINILRSPDGCPWDQAQTHQTIRKNLIEEMYELLETIDLQDMDHMQEELGDVLLQVMLHSQFASEAGYFHIYDVIKQLNDKLVRRHPHVFGNEKAEEANEAFVHWENSKQQEREAKGEEEIESILNGIPKDLPEVLKAYKLQSKAAKVGFDWSDIADVYQKINEEMTEIQQANEEERLGEVGDLLFAVINLARFLDVDPESALALTNQKFIERFHYIENQLKQKQIDLKEASLETIDQLWNDAKKMGKGNHHASR